MSARRWLAFALAAGVVAAAWWSLRDGPQEVEVAPPTARARAAVVEPRRPRAERTQRIDPSDDPGWLVVRHGLDVLVTRSDGTPAVGAEVWISRIDERT